MPPQNVSLWQVDYFDLRTIRAQWTWKELYTSSSLLKRIEIEGLYQKENYYYQR